MTRDSPSSTASSKNATLASLSNVNDVPSRGYIKADMAIHEGPVVRGKAARQQKKTSKKAKAESTGSVKLDVKQPSGLGLSKHAIKSASSKSSTRKPVKSSLGSRAPATGQNNSTTNQLSSEESVKDIKTPSDSKVTVSSGIDIDPSHEVNKMPESGKGLAASKHATVNNSSVTKLDTPVKITATPANGAHAPKSPATNSDGSIKVSTVKSASLDATESSVAESCTKQAGSVLDFLFKRKAEEDKAASATPAVGVATPSKKAKKTLLLADLEANFTRSHPSSPPCPGSSGVQSPDTSIRVPTTNVPTLNMMFTRKAEESKANPKPSVGLDALPAKKRVMMDAVETSLLKAHLLTSSPPGNGRGRRMSVRTSLPSLSEDVKTDACESENTLDCVRYFTPTHYNKEFKSDCRSKSVPPKSRATSSLSNPCVDADTPPEGCTDQPSLDGCNIHPEVEDCSESTSVPNVTSDFKRPVTPDQPIPMATVVPVTLCYETSSKLPPKQGRGHSASESETSNGNCSQSSAPTSPGTHRFDPSKAPPKTERDYTTLRLQYEEEEKLKRKESMGIQSPSRPVTPKVRLVCEHCRKRGHSANRCFKLHPELNPYHAKGPKKQQATATNFNPKAADFVPAPKVKLTSVYNVCGQSIPAPQMSCGYNGFAEQAQSLCSYPPSPYNLPPFSDFIPPFESGWGHGPNFFGFWPGAHQWPDSWSFGISKDGEPQFYGEPLRSSGPGSYQGWPHFQFPPAS